jgi:hypothetical protein
MHNRSIAILILSLLLGACAPLTKEEKAMQAVKQINPQSEADSIEECTQILETQPWCTITKSAKRIEYPEWIELLPSTEFYLVAYDLIGSEGKQSRNVLVIEQNERSYRAETFDDLLDANQIAVADQNRELIAKAFALMTLADYLGGKVDFTQWENVSLSRPARHAYNYHLTAFTEIGSLEVDWWFVFSDDQLEIASGPQWRSLASDSQAQSLPPLEFMDYRFP